jgi:hypothetical protein
MRKVAFVVVLVASVVAAWPAGAAAGGRPSYHQPPTPYTDHVVADDICEGFVTEIQFDGVESLRNVPGSDGQAFLYTDVYTRHERWTNSATGRTFTVDADATVKEVLARRVAKRDVPAELIPADGLIGPIYRFRTLLIGEPFTLRDSNGRVRIHERGLVVFESLFDTLGDHAPGGTQLSNEPVRIVGPHATLEPGFELCAYAERITHKR